jgi:hypothetical protein
VKAPAGVRQHGSPPASSIPTSSLRSFWTRDVLAVAQSIHAHRAFEDLPALADALEEVGCDCVELLDHLRGGGPHFLGCWALDLLMGRG